MDEMVTQSRKITQEALDAIDKQILVTDMRSKRYIKDTAQAARDLVEEVVKTQEALTEGLRKTDKEFTKIFGDTWSSPKAFLAKYRKQFLHGLAFYGGFKMMKALYARVMVHFFFCLILERCQRYDSRKFAIAFL